MPRLSRSYVPLLKSYVHSRKIGMLGPWAEVIYLRLLAASDDAGRFYARPFKVAAQLLSERLESGSIAVADVAAALDELELVGLLRRYAVEGEALLELTDVVKGARRDRDPKIDFPGPEKADSDTDGHRRAPMGTDGHPLVPTSVPPVPSRARVSENEPEKENDTEREPNPAAPRGRGRPRKVPDTVHAKFLDWWCHAWEDARGSPYAVQAKDAAAVKAIRKLAGEDLGEMQRRARNLLEAEDAWVAENASLSLLRSRWNNLATVPGTASRARQFSATDELRRLAGGRETA